MSTANEPIAIVGMSARFPGASDLDAFWRLLRDRVDAIREVPATRFDVDQFYDPAPGTPGKLSSRWGGFLDDIDRFDAAFFGISPREAARMDPQQRLALEAAWEALDDGGQRPLDLRGTATGVFLGVHSDEYFRLAARDAAEIDLLSVVGGARSGVAGRISYVLGLEGPSLVFDTDRSSSLVAVRAACESLRRGECSLALAGGVNLILAPEPSLGFARANLLAADGRIKFCDARADGIVRSDGVGMVALKPWSAARRDRDPVHALILGAAINHDGGRSGDLMTPSSASQAAVVRAACLDAGVSPHDVQYLEAHGTGTIVGDPVEVAAAAAVLQHGRDANRPLRIGSVKTNIGHAEAAAGIAGLIKVALAIEHRLLPASLHFVTPNPRIAFEGVVVQAATTPWPDERQPLVGGVTSLGLTGVNAHVIVGEAPRDEAVAAAPERAAERVEILAVSARGRVALAALAREYARILRSRDAPPVSALTCAAAIRRSHLDDRLAVVGATHDELARELEAHAGAIAEAGSRGGSRRRPRIALVFPGGGGPRLGDLRALLSTEAAFRDSMLRCDAALRAAAGWSLLDEPDRDGDATLVALEISLAALWRDWGVEPDAVVGTGAGDAAAAQVEGALSIEDAMLAVARRTLHREARDLPAVVGQLLDEGCEVFLEASPHPVALAAIAEQIALAGKPALAVGSLRPGEPARRTLLRSLAALYATGVDVAWRRLFAGTGTADVHLPRYPWQRERYWFARGEAPPTASHGVDPARDPSPPDRGDREPIRDLVMRELARVLEIADAAAIAPRRGFGELGVTSVMAMELVGRLGSALGRALPSSVVFNHPNAEALASHLARVGERSTTVPRARAFWNLLRGGKDAIREVPPERWDLERWYAPEPGRPGKMQTRWGGFLDDIDQFDAAFFGISPREAEEMDPQQRLVLEVAWEALERAGLAPDRLLGSEAGVFLGMMNTNDYAARKRLHDDPARIRAHHGTGIATSIAAGRLAYLLGSTGPAMAIDTACSSSLVAVHLAMRSLRSGECSLALAGGVNAILSPEITVAYSQAGMLSPTGRCRTFDASADGYVRSEGCGMLVLERLSDAVAGGRAVLAILPGAAVNHDGRSSGLTAPNGNAQCAVIRAALEDAGLTPGDVDYVEAHGTGTRLGDPIELHALAEVFGDRPGPLLVGSVKTNVGHLEAAAGVAGLMKVILALQHREIPPHLHLREHNPLLSAERSAPRGIERSETGGSAPRGIERSETRGGDPDGSAGGAGGSASRGIERSETGGSGPRGINIPTRRTTWTKTGRRVAGVSSFGFSGCNAHVIVAEAPAATAAAAARAETQADRPSAQIAVVSARTELALRAAAERHAAHLAAHPELADEHRLAVVVGSRPELIDAFERAARGDRPARSARGAAACRALAWLFTGQGAQRVGMGRELAAAWPVFARALDEAMAALDAHLDRPIADVMWADAGAAEAALVDETGHTQPALFAIEVALAALWRSWGVTPDRVAGHSVGELAAAHVAGVFSLDDAARLVAARARLMQALPRGGAMVAIAAPEADVAVRIARYARTAAIAAVNGPAAVVISGAEAAVAEIAEDFARRGVRTSRLAVSHAFHSPLMEPMLEDFRAVAETVAYRPPVLPGVGNLDGAPWGPEVATADYWVRHIRAPVRFADGVAALYRAGTRTFLELGPRPMLGGLVPACLPADAEVAVLTAMRAERPETEVALEALAGWYAAGGDVAWPSVFPDPRRLVELATYPWQHQRYWIAPPSPRAPVPAATPRGLLGARLSVAAADAVYDQALSVEHQPWLADHRVDGEIVVPAAAMVEMFRAAAAAGRAAELRAIPPPVSLRSIAIQTPLRLDEREPRRVQIVVAAEAIKLYSQADEAAPWILHAQVEAHDAAAPADALIDLAAARARCAEPVDVAAAYAALDDVGLAYGPAFRGIRAAWRGPGEVLVHAIVPDGWPGDDYGAHPALVDAALQAVVVGAGGLYLPFAIERVEVLAAGATEAWACVRYTTPAGEDTLGADVALADPSGRAIAILSGFCARRAEPRVRRGAAMYRPAWLPCEADVAMRAARSGRWAIVGDELAARVCAGLAARGAACTHVAPAR
ncbi:MAG: acyltransferase domain-containing protein, partial [Deltaproteobacteria bacterium]